MPDKPGFTPRRQGRKGRKATASLYPPPQPRRGAWELPTLAKEAWEWSIFRAILCFHRHSRFVPSILECVIGVRTEPQRGGTGTAQASGLGQRIRPCIRVKPCKGEISRGGAQLRSMFGGLITPLQGFCEPERNDISDPGRWPGLSYGAPLGLKALQNVLFLLLSSTNLCYFVRKTRAICSIQQVIILCFQVLLSFVPAVLCFSRIPFSAFAGEALGSLLHRGTPGACL
jgi:hypothetical protein